jgi:hypothetical protein
MGKRIGMSGKGARETGMKMMVTDEDILRFLRKNWHRFPSHMVLMQAAVRALWPGGAPQDGGERVVRLCLQESTQQPIAYPGQASTSTGSAPLAARLGTMPL